MFELSKYSGSRYSGSAVSGRDEAEPDCRLNAVLYLAEMKPRWNLSQFSKIQMACAAGYINCMFVQV